MILLPPEFLDGHVDLLESIDRDLKTIYRLLVFDDRLHTSGLMARYQEAVQHLRDVFSIKNAQQEAQTYEEALEYLAHLKSGMALITEEIRQQNNLSGPVDIFRLYRAIAPEAAMRHANSYRRELVVVGSYLPPDPEQVSGLMDQLFYYLQQIKHPVLQAVYFHHEFIRIHPFLDGNGRVGRMAKNWMLMYHLYPPVFIYGGTAHQRYIRGLEASFDQLLLDPYKSNDATRQFFIDEIHRTGASIRFIINRMLVEQALPFGPEDEEITPYAQQPRDRADDEK